MARKPAQPDVLVLGDHPAAYLAAALLREKAGVRVAHATLPGDQQPDRLVLINPAFFALHKILEPLKRKLDTTGLWGVTFLADDGQTRTEHRGKQVMSYVAALADVRDALKSLAEKAGAELHAPRSLSVDDVDESGVSVTVGRTTLKPRALLLAGTLPPEQARVLAIPLGWPEQVLHRYAFRRLKGEHWTDAGARPTLPMSLDLGGKLNWAWVLQGRGEAQLCIEQPIDGPPRTSPEALLKHWAKVLHAHGILTTSDAPAAPDGVLEMPLAGALERESVASRTLLIGPAGGFFSASGEDIYPNCWSALHAVDVIRKALKEPHLQDALRPYRERWGATLGEYLRGPQQNLRFLMPLVYRNPVMTQRLAESILLGKQVVR